MNVVVIVGTTVRVTGRKLNMRGRCNSLPMGTIHSLHAAYLDNQLMCLEKIMSNNSNNQLINATITRRELLAIYNGEAQAPEGWELVSEWRCDPPAGGITTACVQSDSRGHDHHYYIWLEQINYCNCSYCGKTAAYSQVDHMGPWSFCDEDCQAEFFCNGAKPTQDLNNLATNYTSVMSNNKKVSGNATNNSSKRTLKTWVLAALVGFFLPMGFALFAAAVVYFGAPAVTNEHKIYLVHGLKNGLIFGTICGLVAAVVEHITAEVK